MLPAKVAYFLYIDVCDTYPFLAMFYLRVFRPLLEGSAAIERVGYVALTRNAALRNDRIVCPLNEVGFQTIVTPV